MAIDYCQTHHRAFDRDHDTLCPECESTAQQIPQPQWIAGPFSHRLMRGEVCVAVIIPMPPRPWNDNCGFKVDGRGLKGPINVRSLETAREVAEANARI